ncbi:WbqC family protein [Mesorhizobium sp. BH1-1-4]|uniref:WbqC family protein n=1 Tax=Mesorhizobium sp. BH1-1-4 TaxID=2876662 RepID=UPI001CD0FC8E|nr:WbqC family protein [Mesorhizobium sp. BH1-1-4]MBZ9993448.1 WbqC family protein [Mesorhizobium sp. BH1-1-4]
MTGKRTIAVMQPYFFPYAGYFRLLAACDVFVIFDDVQFPRRGRVHRCQMSPGRWLTLPLAPMPFVTLIKNLRWASDARSTLDKRLAVFGLPDRAATPVSERISRYLTGPLGDMTGYLEEGLRLTADALDLEPEILRSSNIDIDPTLRGQERVISIVQALGGQRYINAPGGRSLYEAEAFREAGIDLHFLVPYAGRFPYILPALCGDHLADLRDDVRTTSRWTA